MKAQLHSINQFQKLVFYTEEKTLIDQLLGWSKEFGKGPINPDDKGMYFNVTLQAWMKSNLFRWSKLVGKPIAFSVDPVKYDFGDERGSGWYLMLMSDLRP